MSSRRLLVALSAALLAGTANASVPRFAAKCGAGIAADSNPKGQVYINGRSAPIIQRADGQISANSAGIGIRTDGEQVNP